MLGLWNIDWLNQNSQRAYPIGEWGTQACADSPDVKLPNDFLLALRLSVATRHSVRVESFFIKSIVVSSTGCTVTVGYNDGLSRVDTSDYPAVASVVVLANTDQSTYALVGTGEFSDTVGYLAVNPYSSIFQQVTGYFRFTPDATPIEPDCIVPMIRAISSFTVGGRQCYGDVTFTAGSNISISTSSSGATSQIRISVDPTANLNSYKADCASALVSEHTCVRTINGVGPDSTGNITLTGTGCATFTGSGGSITLEDTCATPDCGCDQLATLEDTVHSLSDGAKTLTIFLEQLHSSLVRSSATIELSRGVCYPALVGDSDAPAGEPE